LRSDMRFPEDEDEGRERIFNFGFGFNELGAGPTPALCSSFCNS
jgi:hypothetical protein